MRGNYTAMPGTALLCALAFAFCLWASFGGGPEICFTAGCSLYSDFSIAGISMWVVGMASFAVLAVLALLGRARLGYALAMLGLACDAALLILMLITAPCFNCLIVALFLLSVVLSFRASQPRSWDGQARSKHVLVLVWTFFFLCNVGVVIKTQIPLYTLSDNEDEATVRVFFSPSCPACRQALDRLAGSVDVAFYPVAENDLDVARVERMAMLLAQGENIYDAMLASNKADYTGQKGLFGYGSMGLRLRLLRNKAYLFTIAGPVIPFIEYRGLPRHLSQPMSQSVQSKAAQTPAPSRGGDPAIPVDSSVSGFCYGGTESCEEDGFTRRPRQ